MNTIEQQALELYPDSAGPGRQYRQELQRAAFLAGAAARPLPEDYVELLRKFTDYVLSSTRYFKEDKDFIYYGDTVAYVRDRFMPALATLTPPVAKDTMREKLNAIDKDVDELLSKETPESLAPYVAKEADHSVAPERIFLQMDPEVPYYEQGEVTHCLDRINDTDVEYIRAKEATESEPWISVEDRVPEAEGRYLCVNVFYLHLDQRWTYNPVVERFMFYRMRDSGELAPRDGITGCFQDDLGYSVQVTHWMPLPAPPSTKNDTP